MVSKNLSVCLLRILTFIIFTCYTLLKNIIKWCCIFWPAIRCSVLYILTSYRVLVMHTYCQMVLYILTGYQVFGFVYLNQLSGARHTHISYHIKMSPTGAICKKIKFKKQPKVHYLQLLFYVWFSEIPKRSFFPLYSSNCEDIFQANVFKAYCVGQHFSYVDSTWLLDELCPANLTVTQYIKEIRLKWKKKFEPYKTNGAQTIFWI